ncbi:Uncharacterized membrane protein [Methylomagnum ishizawai]|uniref:Uncharacterized membrane protein n=1 Tax=Methylomagnum ishizawai TaxID=1760988 RepID=A0A1Y6D4P3_9GAMM|nr:DUF2282 domain-containing protein [Methylomagnum ishizawai]SMF97627.1 Uncharacterized membrane protein [Methylomagnum ishizawai]
MNPNKTFLTSTLAAVVALGLSANAQAAEKKADGEKCYGVVKAGKNDCKTLSNACAGHAMEDGQKDAFLVVPKGTCERIVGGSLEAPQGGK